MLFSSNVFIWIFLPFALVSYYLIHFLIPKCKLKMAMKNILLTILSLIFYAWGGIEYIFVMLSSIIINYVAGLLIGYIVLYEKSIKRKKKKGLDVKKIILIEVIIFNIGMLFYFKYFNMFLSIVESVIANKNVLSNMLLLKRTYEIPIPDVVLPIGISFFTFQSLSYVIDVYRGVVKCQESIIDFALYVSFFPQLIAGPIVKYKEIKNYISYRTETLYKFSDGIKRFCYGIGKKVILANTFAEFVDGVWGLELEHIGCVLAIFAAVLYALQLYYDFSGYSDMAIGLGEMFGFKFEENFKYPYLSLSITEFWRRWHISLSTWFKEYVYIPLGGSRNGKFKTYINLLIVFFITGFWHGANFTFIIWGIMHGIFLVIEKLFLGRILEKSKLKFINYIYMLVVVVLLFVVFRADNIFDAFTLISQMFVKDSKYSIYSYMSMKFILCIIIGILGMGIIQKIFYSLYGRIKNKFLFILADYTLQITILVYCICLIASNTYNPFIYFRF